jgi:hypothetical protein
VNAFAGPSGRHRIVLHSIRFWIARRLTPRRRAAAEIVSLWRADTAGRWCLAGGAGDAGAEGNGKGGHRVLEVGARPCISCRYPVMFFRMIALSAVDVLFAVQVDRLP